MDLTLQISSREEELSLLLANQYLQMGYSLRGDCALQIPLQRFLLLRQTVLGRRLWVSKVVRLSPDVKRVAL